MTLYLRSMIIIYINTLYHQFFTQLIDISIQKNKNRCLKEEKLLFNYWNMIPFSLDTFMVSLINDPQNIALLFIDD